MLPDKLAFVDIETTGGSSSYDRIMEIGIIRVEGNKIVQTYNSLLNPHTHIPPEIQRLTGITPPDLENAPSFTAVYREVLEMLKDCVLVAHNVRFDYGFLKAEFGREEIQFNPKHFCTVKLSRYLYPMHRHHNLDSIIERFNLSCVNRHRAYDDAKVLVDFYTHLQKTIEPDTLLRAVNHALKKPSVPLNLDPEDLAALPESPGVYIFRGEEDIPLYIGKSINLKDRVLSHFAADIHSGTEMKIAQQIRRIETIPTAGELGALFLESSLIKNLLPLYNKRLRLKKQLVALIGKKDSDGYEQMKIERVQDITSTDIRSLQIDKEKEGIIGFFKSQKQAKEYLLQIAVDFGLCEKLLGVEKTTRACFGYRLGRCKGACLKEESPLLHNIRLQTALSKLRIKPWPFTGPILIEEKHPLSAKKEYFVIDKWCYLGSVYFEGDENRSEMQKNILFDLDMYKILRGYLLNPANHRKIKVLTKENLSSFAIPTHQSSLRS